MSGIDSQLFNDNKGAFLNFLEKEDLGDKYKERIKEALEAGSFRLIVNINEIRQYDQDLATRIIRQPRASIVALQAAVKQFAGIIDPKYDQLLKSKDVEVGFEGSFGSNSVSPRGLMSSLLNNLVEVEGIVTKCSSVKPKLVKSVHYCPDTGSHSSREYRDATAMDIGFALRTDREGTSTSIMPTSSVMPSKTDDGHYLEMEQGLSEYKDCQTIVLQEMPERAKVGQLPRSIEILLEHDLVDRVKPGDRIQCVGVYRPLSNAQNQGSGIFRSLLMCNNISMVGKEVGTVRITPGDVGNIRALAAETNTLDLLARSLCPSIHGHEFIKRSLVLQLLGGCERNLANGTHLRGDINVMLVGDPSTAKSQLLRAVLDIAPLAISTTGRGSSGVGLTAAVTMDVDSGDKRLEAGAMVLADRGVVCIDEFDKMGENDRVAIHEVMEQQTVTIAKAGIHASLNARCSVLAAANPIYGQYNKDQPPQKNIGLPDSLLSRFDLLFIVLDQLDPVTDRRISEHVVKSHQYRRAGTIMEPEPLNQGSKLNLEDGLEVIADTPMWQRGGKVLDKAASSAGSQSVLARAGDLLTKEFLRKFIHFAKSRIQPVLSDAAMEAISSAYAEMRSKQSSKNLPVTARSLETIM